MTTRYICLLAKTKNDDERKRVRVLGTVRDVKAIIGLPDNFPVKKADALLCKLEEFEKLLASIDRQLPYLSGDCSLQLIWFVREIREDDLEEWMNFMSPLLKGIELEAVESDPVFFASIASSIGIRAKIEAILHEEIKKAIGGEGLE